MERMRYWRCWWWWRIGRSYPSLAEPLPEGSWAEPRQKKTLMELFDMSQNTSVKREASTLTAQVCWNTAESLGGENFGGLLLSAPPPIYCTLVSCLIWHTTLLTSHQDAVSGCRLLWTGRPSVAAYNRRWSIICCCWPQALEHSAWGH